MFDNSDYLYRQIKPVINCLIYVLLLMLFLSNNVVLADIQSHSFTITGDGGEVGSGSFTWDDAIVLDGTPLAFANVLSLNFTLTGANLVGGATNFTLADCSSANLMNTPDFSADLSFTCNDGAGNTVSPADPFSGNLNGGLSTLTYIPGATVPVPATPPTPIPTLSEWGVLILSFLIGSAIALNARFYHHQ